VEARFYEPSMLEAWNAFNQAARNGHFLFDRGYMDYHSDRFTDASLVLLDDGHVIGLLPANQDGGVVHSHQGLTFGGLISEAAGTVAVMQMLDLCAEALRSRGAGALLYKALPWIYQRRPAQEDLYWLFRKGAPLVRRDVTAAIDYRAAGPRSSRRRRGAQKAEKAGLVYARSGRWREFWALLATVLEARHGAQPVHTLAEIERLAAAFPEAIALHTAERDGVVLAGVVMFASAQVAHAQYIAAGDEARALGALDGLFTHLIDAYAGYRYFDFGISNTAQGRELNEGLVRQKEEFGASAVAHDFYRVELG
jgi:Acetyltransferase (GNAT) domain